MNEEAGLKRWLIAETVVLTMVPAWLLVYSLPLLIFAAVVTVVPLDSDTRALHERLFGLTPYLGGALALWTIWRHALAVAENKILALDWRFVAAALGGGLATWEVVSTTGMAAGVLISLPTWLLAMHLLYLRSQR